jgi:UDP-N-acetylmuramate dehydrogenase
MHASLDTQLRPLNSLALTASASALAEVQDLVELDRALLWARERGFAVTVLGEGSNVVLAGDVEGLVLAQRSRGIEILAEDGDEVTLRVAAGENWHALVQWALGRGFNGLENLALIPGTVGAAPIQNIGAYGVELEPFVRTVHAVQIEDSQAVLLSAAQCQFGYRDSVFKHAMRDQLVITAVDLQLKRGSPLQLSYPALAAALAHREAESLTHRDVFDAVVAIRQSRLPDPSVEPNVGSFFKNPVLRAEHTSELMSRFPELPVYRQANGLSKIPAAWLIDYCGWKGHRENGVAVHPQHALVLVNCGADDGQAVLALAKKIADSVYATFSVTLEIEPRVYGKHDG